MNNLISQDYLMHHGVKGMRWGVRHDKRKAERLERKRIKKVKKQYSRNWYKTYNKATYRFNDQIDSINERYKNDKFDDNFTTKRGQEYVKEFDTIWQKEYRKALKEDYGDDAKLFVNDAPFMYQYASFIIDK